MIIAFLGGGEWASVARPLPSLIDYHYCLKKKLLIRAATQKDSIENTTKVLKNVPTSNDIRYHLEKYSDLKSLELDLDEKPVPN
ncbi:transposase, IS4 [Kalymmatonema gypsitolerans NIES-4073]|nr:transposase, IS4 [Scytonema sp. NIES-4073]